jgi:hypothetical protein
MRAEIPLPKEWLGSAPQRQGSDFPEVPRARIMGSNTGLDIGFLARSLL